MLPNCHPIGGCLLHREFGKRMAAGRPAFVPRTPLQGSLSYPATTPLSPTPVESRFSGGQGPSVGERAMVLPQRRGMERDRGTAQADALSALQGGRHADSARLSARLRREQPPAQKPSAPGGSFAATARHVAAADGPSASGSPTKSDALSLTTRPLWRFLQRAVAGSIAAAIRAADCHLSDRTWQRIWKRFDLGQSKIRTALSGPVPAARAAGGIPHTGRRPKSSPISRPPSPTPTVPSPPSNMTLRTFFV